METEIERIFVDAQKEDFSLFPPHQSHLWFEGAHRGKLMKSWMFFLININNNKNILGLWFKTRHTAACAAGDEWCMLCRRVVPVSIARTSFFITRHILIHHYFIIIILHCLVCCVMGQSNIRYIKRVFNLYLNYALSWLLFWSGHDNSFECIMLKVGRSFTSETLFVMFHGVLLTSR